MIEIPGMLMIGATGRNVGKTDLACSVIRKFSARGEITGVKVTTVSERGGTCPRGGKGCGVCSSLDTDWCITEETDTRSDKDTARMLAAGAGRVLWLRVLKAHLREGAEALIDGMGSDAVSVCESNSLRLVAKPGLFLMVKDENSDRYKSSAKDVREHADRIVMFDGEGLDLDPDDIELVRGEWVLRERATAVILAGGNSARMGQDKALLPIGGRPMIEHICDQLRPHFKQILLSANDADKYAFLGVPVVPDKVPGQGPLMGIASALEASAHDLNLVIACDIPGINIDFVRRMLAEAEGYDGVVPVTNGSRYEPLLALYRKSVLGPIREVLSSGRRRVRDLFELCRINCIELGDAAWLRNLNTVGDYTLFREEHDDHV